MRAATPSEPSAANGAPAPAPAPEPAATPEWLSQGERSNLLALKFMAWVATTLGRGWARGVLHPITLYYLLFARSAARHSQRYLGRVLGRAPTWAERYRHFHHFASVVLDRVYFVRGQMQRFDLQVLGGPLVDETLADGQGAFMLGAHFGSFEAMHAIGATRPGMRVAHVMYPENARMIHSVLQALAPGFAMSVIGIGRPGSTLQIRDWLDGGGLVGLLGDRWLPEQAQPGSSQRGGFIDLPFFGHTARFTDGPLRLALLLRRRVLFMAGVYQGGNRYALNFEELVDFRQAPRDPAAREVLLRQAMLTYVTRLETHCQAAPHNWFNFYDFWHEDVH